MMNVLWLASWYPNNTNPFDGDFIERHAMAVSKYVQLTVLFVVKDDAMPHRSFKVDKTTSGNLTVYRGYYGPSSGNPVVEKFISFRKYRNFQKKLYQQIAGEQGNPDIVHVQVAMKAGLLALYLKSKFNIPFIVTEHWSGYYKYCTPNVYSGNWLLNRINKKVLQQTKLLITVSDNLGKTINENFTAVPYKVIPNVVDTGLFFYKPAALPRFRFIHPSGLIHVKNPEGIIAACKLAKDKGYDFELLLLGAENAPLINLAKENGLLNTTVFFKGVIPYTAVAAEMQQSSALLMFSRHENMSCVVLEALCCGLPVICTHVGGMPEVIDEQNGLLVESENVEQLAAAMCNMLSNYARYNRHAIAENAKEKFNYDAVARQHLEIYEQLLIAKPV